MNDVLHPINSRSFHEKKLWDVNPCSQNQSAYLHGNQVGNLHSKAALIAIEYSLRFLCYSRFYVLLYLHCITSKEPSFFFLENGTPQIGRLCIHTFCTWPPLRIVDIVIHHLTVSVMANLILRHFFHLVFWDDKVIRACQVLAQ